MPGVLRELNLASRCSFQGAEMTRSKAPMIAAKPTLQIGLTRSPDGSIDPGCI